MTMHNYSICLYEKMSQDVGRTPRRQPITLESLCPVKHSLPPVQSAFKRDFHHLYISCILRHTEDAEETPTVFARYAVGVFQHPFRHSYFLVRAVTICRVVYGASWFELVRFHFQRVCTATTVVLDLSLTVNTIAAVGNL